MTTSLPLNHNRLRFVAEYLSAMPRNGTAAYGRVYTTASYDTCCTEAARLLKDPRIAAEIDKREKQMQAGLALTAADVLEELFLVASADPRELSEHHVGACRYCHGAGFLWHRTQGEYQRDYDAYVVSRKADTSKPADPFGIEFPVLGGIGYNPYKDPHPNCPECFGNGVGFDVYKDTRNLSKAAARLFQGVKRTKEGIEIKIRSPEKAIELAGQHLGLFKKSIELAGKNGGPIQHAGVTLTTTDPNTAAAIYQSLVSGD